MLYSLSSQLPYFQFSNGSEDQKHKFNIETCLEEFEKRTIQNTENPNYLTDKYFLKIKI